MLLSALTLLSKELDCYKFTLECLTQNVGFHKKFGYTVSEEKCRKLSEVFKVKIFKERCLSKEVIQQSYIPFVELK